MVSKKLKAAIKLNDEPAYKLAQRAGVDPCTLSKLIHGIVPVRPDDPRILKVAKVVGVPAEECFE